MTDEPLTCGRNGRSGAVHALQQSTLGIRRRETRFKACGASIQTAEFRGGGATGREHSPLNKKTYSPLLLIANVQGKKQVII